MYVMYTDIRLQRDKHPVREGQFLNSALDVRRVLQSLHRRLKMAGGGLRIIGCSSLRAGLHVVE
jgi:hypothetical protein